MRSLAFSEVYAVFQGLPLEQQQQLVSFARAIHAYNQSYNIAGFKTVEGILLHLVYESLLVDVLSPFAPGAKALDLGSGAGIPGVALAILYPATAIDSLDKSPVKVHFQTQIQTSLHLANFYPYCTKVEEWNLGGTGTYDYIVSRAFRPLGPFLKAIERFVGQETRILLWKGADWEKEWSLSPKIRSLYRVEKLLAYHIDWRTPKGLFSRKSYLLELERIPTFKTVLANLSETTQ